MDTNTPPLASIISANQINRDYTALLTQDGKWSRIRLGDGVRDRNAIIERLRVLPGVMEVVDSSIPEPRKPHREGDPVVSEAPRIPPENALGVRVSNDNLTTQRAFDAIHETQQDDSTITTFLRQFDRNNPQFITATPVGEAIVTSSVSFTLPMWGWALVGVGVIGIGVGSYYIGKSSSSDTSNKE